MIRVDKGAAGGTCLATCTRCPGFREVRFSTAAAWVAGREHAIDVHTLKAEREIVRHAIDNTNAAIRRTT